MSTFRSFLLSASVGVVATATAGALLAALPAPAQGQPAAAASSAVAAAPGEVKTNKRCRPARYKPSYRITTAHQAPAVTHVRNHGISPGGSRTVTKGADFEQQLRAKANFKYHSELGVGIAKKVLAKAEVRIDAQLAFAGTRTTRKNIKITDVVSNPTSTNKIFVFYRGFTRATGGFRYYFCKIYYLPGQNYGPAFVTYRIGKWKSFRVRGEGALRCGAGSGGNALAAAALGIGCP